MSKTSALARFKEVFFHPSVRWYTLPNKDVRVNRYPAPGSEPHEKELRQFSYKTAYRDSIHTIRWTNDEIEQKEYQWVQDPLSETPGEKLYRYGYIARNEIKDESAISAGRAKYEETEGESLDNKIHVDDLGVNESVDGYQNREAIAQAVRGVFEEWNSAGQNEGWQNNLDDIWNPTLYIFKSYDMIADDPVWRQLKLDLEWHLEYQAETRVLQGYQPIFEGDPEFWHALDNSFSPENIQLIESAIGNKNSNLNSTDLALQHNTETHHKETRIQYPIGSKLF